MGMVITSKRVPLLTAPTTGIQAGTLTVGSVVKLMEGGTAVEYIVVNQGKPSALYDDSCDGTWLLRKDIHSERQWGDDSKVNAYKSSIINTWLNGDFFSNLGSAEQSVVKQVKIPYHEGRGDGGSDVSGANGLSCKVFLLGGYELGFTTSNNKYFPVDGAKLSYFESGTGTSAKNKRIAYLDGVAVYWWLRSPYKNDNKQVWAISDAGSSFQYDELTYSHGIRPALILPSTAKFDETTLQLKGVA